MPKQRSHNEWFRTVKVRTVYGTTQRPPELIDDILSRPDNRLTREFLETPYRTVVGYESSCKSCPTCKAKLGAGEFVWSWGEYVNARWRTVKHFCRQCYIPEVQTPLSSHTTDCGCVVTLCVRHDTQPDWMTLNTLTKIAS